MSNRSSNERSPTGVELLAYGIAVGVLPKDCDLLPYEWSAVFRKQISAAWGLRPAVETSDAKDASRWRFVRLNMCYSFDGQDRIHYLKAYGRESFEETVDRRLTVGSPEEPSEQLGPVGHLRKLGWEYNAASDSLIRIGELPPVEPEWKCGHGFGQRDCMIEGCANYARPEKDGARCEGGCHVHWSGWPASHHPNCTVNGTRDV